MRVKVKELPKSCIGTKEEERAIVQPSTLARKESETTKEHQSQRGDAEEETEKVVKNPKVIDVDKYQPSQKSQKQKFWIRELNLLEETEIFC